MSLEANLFSNSNLLTKELFRNNLCKLYGLLLNSFLVCMDQAIYLTTCSKEDANAKDCHM